MLLRPLLLAVGLAVVVWLVWDLGPAAVWEAIYTQSGALEGGNVAVFAAFGLPGAAGLSFSLVRRLREATCALIGLGALAAFKSRPEGPAADGSSPAGGSGGA